MARVDLIAGAVSLAHVMTALSRQRPIFHSEADFQFSFAQAVAAMAPQMQCRLERPMLNSATGRTEYLDLLCAGDDGETAIEFKYFTRTWKGVVGGEAFDLRAHAATDLLRLHFVHDIARLERFGSANSGLAVLLTNESGLWTESARKSRDREFHLHEGRQMSGALLWAEGAYPPNTRELRGTYALSWQDYSSLDDQRGGRFRYLAVEVPPPATSVPLGSIEPKSHVAGPSDQIIE